MLKVFDELGDGEESHVSKCDSKCTEESVNQVPYVFSGPIAMNKNKSLFMFSLSERAQYFYS
jgi:hypothetical protein